MFEIIGAVVLILLTMVTYASGITLAARRREYPVAVLDLVAVAGLWVVLFWLRPQLSRPFLLVATIVSGVLVGYAVGAIRLAGHDEAKELPKSELPEHAREKVATTMSPNLLKRVWSRWSDFSGRMGNVQGRLLMGFFYFFIVTPFGLVGRLLIDTLAIKKPPAHSNWHPKEIADLTLETAKEQG